MAQSAGRKVQGAKPQMQGAESIAQSKLIIHYFWQELG